MFLLYINLDILIYVLFISSGSFVRSILFILYTLQLYPIHIYISISLSLSFSIYLNIDVYLCACLSVCTPFLIIFSRVFRKCSNMIYPIILVIHTYCYITRLYADEPLYYYLDLLYFRYGLQFRLKDRTSSYFVICIPKTEPEMYRNSKHSSK